MMHKISFFELSRNLFGSFIGAAFRYGLHFDNVNEKSIMWPFEGQKTPALTFSSFFPLFP